MAFVSETSLFSVSSAYNEANDGSQSPCISPTGDFLYFLTDAADSIIQTTPSGASPTVLDVSPVTQVRIGMSVSSDGSKILFSGHTGDFHDNVYVMNSDGSGGPTALTAFGYFTGPMRPAWSPDDSQIVFNAFDVTTSHVDMYTMNADGSSQTAIITNSGSDTTNAANWGSNDKLLFVGTISAVTSLYTSNPDGTGMSSLSIDLSPMQTSYGTPLWNTDATEIYYWCQVSGTTFSIARSHADGSSSEFLVSGDATPPGPANEAAGLAVKGNESLVYYVAGEFGIYAGSLVPLGITFALFNNENLVDWSKEVGSNPHVGFDFFSYFVSGYKLRGEGIRKFQSNWVELWGNVVAADQQFDFTGLFDYAIANTSGRWTNKQRVHLAGQDDDGLSRKAKRLKIRGHGKVLQFRIDSVAGHPFNIEGWATYDTVNQKP